MTSSGATSRRGTGSQPEERMTFAEMLQLLNPRPKGHVSRAADPPEAQDEDVAPIDETTGLDGRQEDVTMVSTARVGER